jgi:hypothetical protein
MTLDLPVTGTEHPPLFSDLEQCLTWQKALPLSNPSQVQAYLLRQLSLLNRFAVAADVRLAMLETLRETVHFVQGEGAKKFSGKLLPLAESEQAALDTVHALWQALATGYLRCLDACLAGDAGLSGQAGLVCQRALAALAEDHADQLRANRQPDSAHWRLAHAVYASAETLGVAGAAVEDGLRGVDAPSAMAAYAELALLHTAGLHELTARQQTWVIRWARRWSGKLQISSAPPPEDASALPLCADLESEEPPGFKPQSGPGARWLDTAALRQSLNKRANLLAAGGEENTPARIGLGDDCPQPACGEILRRVYPRWVKGGIRRRYDRHPFAGSCRFVVGEEAIHYYLSGRETFQPPGTANHDKLRREREELATFGRVAARFKEEHSRNLGFQLENWEIAEDWAVLDQSTGGLRLVRPLAQPGGRFGLGQLVAVQPAGSTGLLLGMVRWALVIGEDLAAGIQLFPGRPSPVAVRGTGVMAANEAYRPGFLLPPVAALNQPASIVLAPGGFKPNRIVEAWAKTGAVRIRLKELLERSADFERAAYEPAD